MPQEMKGRRVQIPDGHDPYLYITEAGDYGGPIAHASNGVPAVFFLLPVARDPDVPGEARALHHIQAPPHAIREEPDGSLTIRESIGAGHGVYYWHGFLTEGQWELNKSKP
jgi:hypothetical protein